MGHGFKKKKLERVGGIKFGEFVMQCSKKT